MRVEPSRDLVIGSGKGVRHGEGQAILRENKGVCHKEPLSLVPIQHPSTKKHVNSRSGLVLNSAVVTVPIQVIADSLVSGDLIIEIKSDEGFEVAKPFVQLAYRDVGS